MGESSGPSLMQTRVVQTALLLRNSVTVVIWAQVSAEVRQSIPSRWGAG